MNAVNRSVSLKVSNPAGEALCFEFDPDATEPTVRVVLEADDGRLYAEFTGDVLQQLWNAYTQQE